MPYKTIILELLQQRTELHEQLRSTRTLLPTVEALSSVLKLRHDAWKDVLSRARPGSDLSQIASEALEMALSEMESRLPSSLPQDETEAHSLDQAMAFVRSHSSGD